MQESSPRRLRHGDDLAVYMNKNCQIVISCHEDHSEDVFIVIDPHCIKRFTKMLRDVTKECIDSEDEWIAEQEIKEDSKE